MFTRHVRRGLVATVTAALALSVSLVAAPAHAADTIPFALPGAPLATTVSADGLPTVQINGVVWKQVIVGDTVYVGGEFTHARPAGSAPGVNTVPRTNMLAYNIKTGVLIDSFAPAFNGKVADMAVTPDKTKLVVAGTFTQVTQNGTVYTRNRAAVFNLPAGTLSTTVVPNLNGVANSVAATNTTFYFGGYFSAINGAGRTRVGAVKASNGAVLPFTSAVADGQVQSIVVAPDEASIVFSGNFTSVGGSNQPGYGLYRADAVTGGQMPLPVNSVFRDGGVGAGVLRLATDGTSFWGVGWVYGAGGNAEGTFQADWATGSLVTLEDCHGDTYDVAPVGDAVYVASHKHFCGNSGGFPQTNPWTAWNSTAWTKSVQGTNKKDIYGYQDHPGTPRPGLLPWFPKTTAGTYTGKGQATWTVTGNADYVLYGGEFTAVNDVGQQGLVRYPTRATAPNKQGPRSAITGASFVPTVHSYQPGSVRVSWPALWDRDDDTLTYEVYRTDTNTKVFTTSQTNFQWNGIDMSFTDTPPGNAGDSVRYAVRAIDPHGALLNSAWATTTISGTDTIGTYGKTVLDDGATKFWRLDEAAGSTAVNDASGADNTTAGAGVTRPTAGALLGSANNADTASTFSGTNTGLAVSTKQIVAPDNFSQEVWFKTSVKGGRIAGFGDGASGTSGTTDRHLYMNSSGQVFFGVNDGAQQIIGSPTTTNLANGAWHQAVATMGSAGMALYIDGKLVNSKAGVTSGRGYTGYWRVGGDKTWSGNQYFNGAIDEYSLYPTALTSVQVNNHWVASGRPSANPNANPTAAFTTPKVSDLTATFDGSTSTDSDGTVASYAWNFGDSTTDTGKTPLAHTYATPGTKTVSLTVTDNQGATNTVTHTVVVPNTKPTPDFSASVTGKAVAFDAAASMDSDGTVASYAWDFGDSTTGTGVSPAHTYSTSGTFPVTLTVTDDRGATNTLTKDVVIAAPPPNSKPTAAFTATPTNLSVAFDGSGSTDDGSVASYAWDFGDTTTGTGQTPTHLYSTPGTYTVTLVVTDNQGLASDPATQTVTVTAPPSNVIANDTFGRTLTSGWGSATVGGAWTVTTGSGTKFSVGSTPNGNAGKITNTAGTLTADLKSTSSTFSKMTAEFSVDKFNEGSYIALVGRQVSATDSYYARLRLAADGTAKLYLLRGSAAGSITGAPSITLPDKILPDTKYKFTVQVAGTSPTTVSAKLWKSTDSEPGGWQIQGTDNTAADQVAGSLGLFTYLPSASPSTTVSFYSVLATNS